MNKVHFRLNEQELLRLNEQVHPWLIELVHLRLKYTQANQHINYSLYS